MIIVMDHARSDADAVITPCSWRLGAVADYCYHVHSSFHGLHIAVHSSLAHSSRCQFKRIRAYTASLLPALVRCSFTCDGVSIGNAQRQASCLQGVAAAATEMLHLSLRRVVSIRALVDGCSKASQMH